MKNNSANQSYGNNADGFELSGGAVKRTIKAQGGDVVFTGGGNAIHTLPDESCTLGKRYFHGNGAKFENGIITGKAGLYVSAYAGNATASDIPCGFYPHFFGTKAITAIQGVLWTAMGMCKGSAVANTIGNITRVSDNVMGVRIGATAGANTSAASYNFFSMCAHDGSLAGMISKHGTYNGTGANRSIVFGGDEAWSPDLVIIKGAGAQAAVFRTSDTTYDSCNYFLDNTASLTTGITSMDTDGFTLGTSATVNSSNVKYTYQAYKTSADGDSDFALTNYVGIGGDGMHIDLPFQPDILYLIPAGANAVLMWTASHTAGSTSYVSAATADVANAVIKVDEYGFTVGANTSINTDGVKCVVVAIKCDR